MRRTCLIQVSEQFKVAAWGFKVAPSSSLAKGKVPNFKHRDTHRPEIFHVCSKEQKIAFRR